MQDIDKFYAEAINKASDNWSLNDYGSERSQVRRFAVATEALGIRSGDVVVDVGCGSGEFGRFLWSNGLDVKYIGYDAVQAMVDLAKRYPQEVHLLDALEKEIVHADHVVCLGVLGVLEGTEQERMDKFFKLFSNLCDHSNLGVAATVQVYKEGLDRSGLRWYMTEDQVAEGFFGLRTEHSDFGWQLRSDYHPHDAMYIGKYKPF